MAVMVMLYTTVLSTKMRNADGRSGHGGGEAEGQWIFPSYVPYIFPCVFLNCMESRGGPDMAEG